MGEGERMQGYQSTKKVHVCIFFWEVVDVDNSQLMNAEQSTEPIDFIWLKHQTMLYLKYVLERCLASVIHVVVMNGKTVNPQNGLMVGFMYHSPSVHVSDWN